MIIAKIQSRGTDKFEESQEVLDDPIEESRLILA